MAAASIVGAVSTVMGVLGISLVDLFGESSGWPVRLFGLAVGFFGLSCLTALLIYARYREGLSVEICGTDVKIAVGDLFACDGVKVIPFDNYYDACVDDKIISRNSLNGVFIERYADKDALYRAIDKPQPSLAGEPELVDNRLRYPLGTVKSCDDYALLAFSHMDGMKRAYLRRGQYEDCLLKMWAELNRMYAGKRVVLPLLGSGITRFENGKPSEDDLLRCMLCTLRASGEQFKGGVLIVLTKNSAERMRLYELGDYVKMWKQGIGEKDGL